MNNITQICYKLQHRVERQQQQVCMTLSAIFSLYTVSHYIYLSQKSLNDEERGGNCLLMPERRYGPAMISHCSVLSVNWVFVVPYSSGSDPTSLICLSESCLALGPSTSFLVHLLCSVPHGSVLGPQMSILYMADLADLVTKHQVNFHSFADDSQIYLHCRISEASSAVSTLEGCISVIGHWMSANRLKLNADKTELLWVGSRHNLASL